MEWENDGEIPVFGRKNPDGTWRVFDATTGRYHEGCTIEEMDRIALSVFDKGHGPDAGEVIAFDPPLSASDPDFAEKLWKALGRDKDAKQDGQDI